MFVIYAGNHLVKGNQDIGTLQQIYGDYQDGWLYLTIIRAGYQHNPIKQLSKKEERPDSSFTPTGSKKNFFNKKILSMI